MMAGNILWQSGAVISGYLQLSGQGEQITNGTRTQASGNLINNGASGGPFLYGTFELVGAPTAAWGAAVTNQAAVDLYLVPSMDGTNFAHASTSGLPPSAYRGSFVSHVSGNVARQRMTIEGVPLMPMAYQAWLHNQGGQTLASGWSLFFNGYNEAYT